MKFVFIFFLVFGIQTISFAKNCEEVRLAIDIGSGSTKMMVAKVDFCQKKIIETLLNESRPLAFNEDLEKNGTGSLSLEIKEKAKLTLKDLVAKGRKFKPKKIIGVATSVFRKARNGKEIINELSKKENIKLKIISQDEEALLGFISAQSTTQEKDIVVWDIGGGSMQIMSKNHKYLGELASVTFKNMVIEVLQLNNPSLTSSPNPINDKRDQAIALARSYARLHVPLVLKEELKEKKVLGVGGVHNFSIKSQINSNKNEYSLDELINTSKLQSKKSDEELVGDYKATDVTNLFLVQGFMEALGVKEVKLANASLLQGLILRD